MTRPYLIIITLSVLLQTSCNKLREEKNNNRQLSESVDTIPMLVMQIQKCSRLYTAEYEIHKIVTHDDVKRLKGNILNHDFDIKLPIGDRKIAIPMDAKLKAYIDFNLFTENNVRREGEKIIITLPDPKVVLTSSKIDQKNIREYVDLTRSHFTDAEMANYEQQGRNSIITSIPQLGILETARDGAAKVLIPLIAQMGYKESNIFVEFRKTYSDKDINTLLDKTNNGR